jgi:RNA polymerase sigma-70 factor (ECF subfamily)
MTAHAALHALAVSPDAAVEDDAPAGRIEVSEADTATFHAVRPRLFGIALRILDSTADADDVVQDAWIRWQSTDRTQVRDAVGFLVITTRRLAINVAQSARARHETDIGPWLGDRADTGADPALDVERAEALDLAVVTLLERLSRTERAAFLLREAFEYPYRRIGHVLAVSEENARQLVTRARGRLSRDRRVTITPGEQQLVLEAFLAAAQTGDLARLERTLTAHLVPRSGRTGRGGTARIPAAERARDARLPVAIAA